MMNAPGPIPLIEQWSDEYRSMPPGSGPEWLGDLKDRAADQFAASGMPNRKTEAWKYTPLKKLEHLAPRFRQPAGQDVSFPASVCAPATPTVDIFDGLLSGSLPECPGGVNILPLGEGMRRFGEPMKKVLESTDISGAGNVFRALNTAFLDQGLVINVEKNVNAGTLLLRWALSGSGGTRIGNFRVVVMLAPGAEMNLVEQFESVAAAAGVLNIVSQINLSDGASLSHTRIQSESDEAVLLTSTSVLQDSGSSYRFSGFDVGGGLVRHGLHAQLAGAGANARFDGAFVLDGQRHVDNHVSVDHAVPGCSSEQFFRGVLGGRSRGVFNGKALIRAGADASSVRQSNANLLLSPLAEMDTKPELEIYADEVEASHGATVGQLDDSAIFYLRSRGLSEDQARHMLTTAFCHAVIDRLVDRDLAGRVSKMIDTAMPGSS